MNYAGYVTFPNGLPMHRVKELSDSDMIGIYVISEYSYNCPALSKWSLYVYIGLVIANNLFTILTDSTMIFYCS